MCCTALHITNLGNNLRSMVNPVITCSSKQYDIKGQKKSPFFIFYLYSCLIVYCLFCSIAKLTQLEELDISGNERMKNLPNEFGKLLESMKELNLSGCSLRSLPGRYCGHCFTCGCANEAKAKCLK